MSKFPGWRNMSGPERRNAKMNAIFAEARKHGHITLTCQPKEFTEGAKAHADGVKWYKNPYPSGSPKAYEWDKGHTEARGETRAEPFHVEGYEFPGKPGEENESQLSADGAYGPFMVFDPDAQDYVMRVNDIRGEYATREEAQAVADELNANPAKAVQAVTAYTEHCRKIGF